ncbi:MAG: serine/threonine protein kinase [Sandaracinaceae bacterium]|nr:serine/threonine protein kinase [Sandaracinaceae bacterium]
MMPPADSPEDARFGPYRLVDRVAVGGMAEVFRAIEPRPAGEDRVICVKRMLPHLASEPGALAMFEEEARLGAHIRHPNVVQMLGFGEAGGQPYLALEYVRGCDLWRLLRWVQHQGLGLPLETCVYVVRQILKGLAAVHEARDDDGLPLGVVHRDVSPSNVLLSVHGDVKLGDLGIAQSHLHAHIPARHSGRRMGKLGYLAPEQVTGAALDVRTDLFAVGVIAAELLMGGKPLFRGGSELAILLAIRDGNIDQFASTAKSLPEPLRAFVVHLLAAAPDARPHSAMEALAVLDAVIAGAHVAETDAPPGSSSAIWWRMRPESS